MWDRCEQLASRHHLPGRTVAALVEAARGWHLRRSLYMEITESSIGEKVGAAVATRDLAAMTRAGLLEAIGERRGRHYVGTPFLRAVWQEIRQARPARGHDDPYLPAPMPRLPGFG